MRRLFVKTTSLEYLACPACHGELALAEGQGAEVESGSLFCLACQKTYPIQRGIPQFIRYAELSSMNRRFAMLYDWFSHVYRLYSRVAFAFLGGEDRCRGGLIDRLELQQKRERVLEVSIGPGVNLPYLSQRGVGQVAGLDISLGQLRACQNYARRRRWEPELFLGDAECLPFQDNSFDCVLHFGGINFFSDKAQAIREMIRVARPGTKIVIGDETERGAKFYEKTLPGFKSSFKQGRASVLAPVDLVPAGMQDVRCESIWGGWFYCLEFRKPA